MARLVAPTGILKLAFETTEIDDGEFVLGGKVGIWGAKIYFEPHELVNLVRLMMKPKVIRYLIKAAFAGKPKVVSTETD